MPIKFVEDTLDNVVEPLRQFYQEVNGKFQLSVEGVKPLSEFNTVHGALAKERNDHKLVKEKLLTYTPFGEVADLQAKFDRITELEAAAAGKLDEAGINKLVESRLTTKLAPIEREKQQLATKITELETTNQAYVAKEKQRHIKDALRDAVKKMEGFQDTAMEDAELLAERVFEVAEDGRVTAKDGVGCTPGIEPAVWLTEMQSKRPHWWGPSSGTGAPGNRTGGGVGGPNPWSADGWNMTEQGKVLKENRTRAEQLAKSAGTVIGGPRPIKK